MISIRTGGSYLTQLRKETSHNHFVADYMAWGLCVFSHYLLLHPLPLSSLFLSRLGGFLDVKISGHNLWDYCWVYEGSSLYSWFLLSFFFFFSVLNYAYLPNYSLFPTVLHYSWWKYILYSLCFPLKLAFDEEFRNFPISSFPHIK